MNRKKVVFNRKKIIFLIGNLGGGGGEKVLRTLLNHLDRDKFEPILLLTTFTPSMDYANDLKRDIKIIQLQHSCKSNRFFHRLAGLKEIIKQESPDVIISMSRQLIALVWSLSLFISKKVKFVVRIGAVSSAWPNDVRAAKGRVAKVIFNFISKRYYRRCSKIICVAQAIQKDFLEQFHIPQRKITTIYNPIDVDKIIALGNQEQSAIDKSRYNIVSVGRLTPVKRLKMLIKAFSRINIINSHLTIIGRGKEWRNLHKLVNILGLKDRVTFLGFRSNPYVYMTASDLFVMTSLREGMPNVVVETLACGVPVVAMDSPGGTVELIKKEVNGLVVPIADGLDGLVAAIEKAAQHKWSSEEIQQIIKFNHGTNKIVREYENAILSIF